MTTALFNTLFDEVLPDVPGVPQNVALNAIRNSIIEFCARSQIWTAEHSAVDIVATQADYPFVPPIADTVIAGVSSVRYNGIRIYPVTLTELDSEVTNWKIRTGPPKRHFQRSSDKLSLFPIPSDSLAGALTFTVALKPSRASTGADSWLFEKYREEFAHGAKYKLFGMQKKPWTDPALAGYHKDLFDVAVSNAAREAAKSMSKTAIRTTSQFM